MAETIAAYDAIVAVQPVLTRTADCVATFGTVCGAGFGGFTVIDTAEPISAEINLATTGALASRAINAEVKFRFFA